MPRPLRAPFPFTETEGIELHCRAERTWERMLEDLRSAKRRILFENYILRDGIACEQVLEALLEAAGRGVRVRVLADAFGSMDLSGRSQARMREAGVELRFFNPIRLQALLGGGSLGRLLQRTHRRIVVVDDRAGWVGGLAVDDQWHPEGEGPTARDTMLRLSGPRFVEQLAERFARLWNWRWMGLPVLEGRLRPVPADPPMGWSRLVPQYARRGPHFRRTLYHRLAHARRRAWLATAYFIPNRRLRASLRAAAKRGVSVRLLLPGRRIDHPVVRIASHRYYSQLLRTGIRIFEYQTAFLHEKVALFDEEWSLVGSPNLDRWSLYLNNELAVETRCTRLARDLEEQFLVDFGESEEILWEEWRKRPRWARFLEEVLGILEPAL